MQLDPVRSIAPDRIANGIPTSVFYRGRAQMVRRD